MKRLLFCAFVIACSAAPVLAGPLELSIQNGIVTLDAQEVTVRQILAEWARVGKTRIVNGERLSGGPVTLKLAGVPEKQALQIVLRTVPGYMAMPRDMFAADASLYDRILIMPTTSAVAAVRPSPLSPGSGGFPGVQGGTNVTQLRPPQPQQPIAPTMPELPDPAADQIDDAAIAAAAAAGLITVPGLVPGAPGMPPQYVPPPGVMSPPAAPAAPAPAATATAPTNPWNTGAGTSQPSLAPPPPPPGTPPPVRQRPAQADR